MQIGRPGRVTGTYEKSVAGLSYILAYAITRTDRSNAASVIFHEQQRLSLFVVAQIRRAALGVFTDN